MKKRFSVFALFIVIAMGAMFMIACNDDTNEPPPQPTAPTLEKSSFAVWYTTASDGTANYKLSWDAYAGAKFKISCDGGKPFEIEQAELPLNDLSAGDVHTVTVTAISSQNLQSEPVTVQFKGTKLTVPYNVRLYGNTNSFGWKESDQTEVYVVSCEKLGLDMQSKPVYTGEIKTIPVYSNMLPIYDLRAIYDRLDLYSMQSFRVCALPYNGNTQRFDFENDTEVIEYQLPSDFSEQSVNFYAGQLSNPSGVHWDFEGFSDHPNYAYIEWSGANNNYKYKVTTTYPDGTSTAFFSDQGASETNFGFGSYVSGQYEVTVQAEYDGFSFVGEDANAKSVTYMFYLQQPAEEILKFKINHTALSVPKNIRIDGENILWDAVKSANNYSAYLLDQDSGLNPASVDTTQTQVSLREIFDDLFYCDEGEYQINVAAYPPSNELVSLENNVPVLNTYSYSDSSATSEIKLKLVAIPKVQNVHVDYENKTITWDGISEAVSYSVRFCRDDGSGFTTSVGSATEYNWRAESLSGFSQIVINAACDYNVITENGVTTMYIPSKYIIEL